MISVDRYTVSSSITLAVVTTIILFIIFNATKPAFVLNCNKNFSRWKCLLYSLTISIIFTLIIAYISLKIDEQNK
jgi:hypothetical protein